MNQFKILINTLTKAKKLNIHPEYVPYIKFPLYKIILEIVELLSLKYCNYSALIISHKTGV